MSLSEYEAEGIPFRTFMYVPEHHPETHELFYEREDEGHLIKVVQPLAVSLVNIVNTDFSGLQATLEVEVQPN